MTITKIDKKYCHGNKVQYNSSNSIFECLMAHDEVLFLRTYNDFIYKYEKDPLNSEMPESNNSISTFHAAHLFEYNKLYAYFSRFSNLGTEYSTGDDSPLSFWYFICRDENDKENSTFCVKFDWKDFEIYENYLQVMTQSEVLDFLYDTSNSLGKCIFKLPNEIIYVNDKEDINILNPYLAPKILHNDIIRHFNLIKSAHAMSVNQTHENISDISQVSNFNVTYGDIATHTAPILLDFKEDHIMLSEFSILFHKKNRYEITISSRKIFVNTDSILRLIDGKEEHDFLYEANSDPEESF